MDDGRAHALHEWLQAREPEAVALLRQHGVADGTLEDMPVRRDGDLLFGPGSYDMKAKTADLLALSAAEVADIATDD